MRILWVATKAPWPPGDGGRLVAAVTLEALRASGHEPTVVAPADPRESDIAAAAARREGWKSLVLVPAAPASLPWAALRGSLGRPPVTMRRHALPQVRQAVVGLLDEGRFDLAHAEQLQALGPLVEAERRGLPIVLRAQNVESELWRGASRAPVLGWFLRREAKRLAAWEGAMVRRVDATIALTARDAARLAELSGVPDRVHHVPAPFPSRLPPAGSRLPGSPVVVLLGSEGWWPNRDGARWFVDRVWPRVRKDLPQAVLHVRGLKAPAGAGVDARPALADSREAFADGAVLVVPLRVASGVRMKILEAWSRGVPVVATPEAALGLEATSGRELLLARQPEDFALALRRVHVEPGLASALVAAGRDRLAARHEPRAVAERLLEVYSSAVSRDTIRG